jgi:hypothetical protein
MPQEKPPVHTRPLFTLQNKWLYKRGSTVHVDILFSPIIFNEIFEKNSDDIKGIQFSSILQSSTVHLKFALIRRQTLVRVLFEIY